MSSFAFNVSGPTSAMMLDFSLDEISAQQKKAAKEKAKTAQKKAPAAKKKQTKKAASKAKKAKPAAPIIATNDVISIPIIPITVIANKALRTIFVMLFKKGISEESIDDFANDLPTVFVMNLITHKPTNKTTIPPNNIGAYSIPKLIILFK